MQCNALSALWSREKFVLGACVMWLQRERERKRDSFGKRKSLSESYESLFPSSSSSSRTVSFRQRHTRTHTSVSRGNFFFFKRCNFDAIVCFAVSLDVGKKEYWTTPFRFFFFFFLVFVFVMKRGKQQRAAALLLGPEWCERGRECGG